MRRTILLTPVLLCSCFAGGQPAGQNMPTAQIQNLPAENKAPAAKPVLPFPPQLEVRVPFEPTAFPNGAHLYLTYELHLTNYLPFPLSLSRIVALDSAARDGRPIAVFEGERLGKMLQLLGSAPSDPKGKFSLSSGQSMIVYMWIEFDGRAGIPGRLVHHVTTDFGELEGAEISTHYTQLRVLVPPIEGPDWIADDGPSNDEDNHHRRGVVILDGRAVDSRRYAIDWKQVRDGAPYSGNPLDVHSYYCYGKLVMAVADGRVVAARDGLPENVPGHGDAFHPAIPITLDTISGNTITLDIGGGQFAYYFHLKPGSLRVKAGDRVRRGQVIAQVGASGDAREPHLHFEVTDSPKVMAGDGVPYLIDRYLLQGASGSAPVLHTNELPLDFNIVTFGDKRNAH
jgi:hypothetical protein